jgi:predicted DCC family thiol-disulfide oxidoreductase YuxK
MTKDQRPTITVSTFLGRRSSSVVRRYNLMSKPIILFDGECNLCSWSVQFIIRRDPKARFRFAALQSPAGWRLLAERGIDARGFDSVVLLDGARWYARSGAALRIARRLSGAWPLLGALLVVPRPLRDWAYDVVARRRYGWFGRADACMVPTPALRERFLD